MLCFDNSNCNDLKHNFNEDFNYQWRVSNYVLSALRILLGSAQQIPCCQLRTFIQANCATIEWQLAARISLKLLTHNESEVLTEAWCAAAGKLSVEQDDKKCGLERCCCINPDSLSINCNTEENKPSPSSGAIKENSPLVLDETKGGPRGRLLVTTPRRSVRERYYAAAPRYSVLCCSLACQLSTRLLTVSCLATIVK